MAQLERMPDPVSARVSMAVMEMELEPRIVATGRFGSPVGETEIKNKKRHKKSGKTSRVCVWVRKIEARARA